SASRLPRAFEVSRKSSTSKRNHRRAQRHTARSSMWMTVPVPKARSKRLPVEARRNTFPARFAASSGPIDLTGADRASRAAVHCLAMRRWAAAACLVSVTLLGAASAGLGPELRDRFSAALTAQKAGDWQTAAKEFGDPAWAGTPLEDYALLFQAESLQRQGDTPAAGAQSAQTADRKPETGLTASALVTAARAR